MADVHLSGVDELARALRELDSVADKGAKLGIQRGSRELVKLTKRNIGAKGTARWSRRGPGPTGPAVDLHRTPVHVERSGGPGSLTGALKENVHAVKPRRGRAGWEGKVSAMGGHYPAGAQNVYAPRVEQAYPFLKPAVETFEALAPDIFERAWAEQMGRVR